VTAVEVVYGTHKSNRPSSQECRRAVSRESPIQYKRPSKASSATACPHNAESEAFPSDEPFINEDEDRVVEQSTTEGVQHSLC
jgi:hypothetical protein